MRFSQVRLLVDDFPACFRFLHDSLGLECTFGGEEDGYASFKAGTGTVAVFRRDEQSEVIELRAAGDGARAIIAEMGSSPEDRVHFMNVVNHRGSVLLIDAQLDHLHLDVPDTHRYGMYRTNAPPGLGPDEPLPTRRPTRRSVVSRTRTPVATPAPRP